MAARLSGTATRDRDAPSAKQLRGKALRADADRSKLLDRLRASTPAQIDEWVDGNTANLAQMRGVVKAILKQMALDAQK